MKKQELEGILNEYNVAFTSSLADRLMREFEKFNNVNLILDMCEESCINASQVGSEYQKKCAVEIAYKHIYKAVKGKEWKY